MNSKARLAAALCLVLGMGLLAMGCGGSDSGGGNDTFRVGLEAPLTGEQSVLGQGMLKGAQLAARD